MSPVILLLLFIPMLGVLAFIFGRNVRGGLRTGDIWAKNVRIYRADQPIGFHITVAVYAIATLACLGGIGIISFVLATN
jgi:hypothetical protein